MKKFVKYLIVGLIFLGGIASTSAAPLYTPMRSILPETTDKYYLGSTTPNAEWNGIYTKDLNISGTCTGCGSGGGTSNNASATSTGNLTSSNWNTLWNGIMPSGQQSNFQHASTSPSYQYATSTYALEDFQQFTERWHSTSGGSIAFSGGVMTVTTPAGNDVIALRTLWTNILHGYDTIDFDINFNGFTVLTAGDTPTMSFEQSGDKGVVLTNFATNGSSAWQHVSIPLSKFTANEDATSGSGGTGTALAPGTTVTNFKIRVYENVAARTVSIKNIILSDSTHTLVQDFTQPDLVNSSKLGNSYWRIQSVDSMKYSKDNMTSQQSQATINSEIAALKPLNLSYVAVDTPYDDCNSYSPAVTCGYQDKWASAIRQNGYNVFWRQHWNSWEGDYTGSGFGKATSTGVTTINGSNPTLTYSASGGIPLGTAAGVLNGSDTTSRLYQTYRYIINHYYQYAPGDIITPIAEPENAGIVGGTTCYANTAAAAPSGDQYCQFTSKNQFNTFLQDNITVVNAALQQIGLKGRVYVGFYGNNANIINGTGGGQPFIDERLADAMGIVSLDDYPNPVSNIYTDLQAYENKWSTNRPMVVTEFGTINDSTTAAQIASVNTYLGALKSKPYILGFNYWVAFGGATENLLDGSLNAIGGFGALQQHFTSGKPITVASCLATLWNGVCVSSASSTPPIAGQVLTALSTTTAGWATPATGSSITAIGPTGQTTAGPTVTLATSSTAYNGLTASTTITGSGSTLTFTNTMAGTLGVGGGGTGQSSYSNNSLLYYNGTSIAATSSNPLYVGSFTATSSTATSNIAGHLTLTGLVASPYLYPSFTYSTSTAWTGTTTIPLGPSFNGETWVAAKCFTDTGTVGVSVNDGTNRMSYIPTASTTVNKFSFSANTTIFTSSVKRYIDIGTPASSPTKISCTIQKYLTNE